MGSAHRGEAGFSLVELAIVVAVVLAVMVVATPSIVNMIYNVRLRSSAYELAGLMQAARTQAIRDNQYLYICYQTTTDNRTQAWIATGNACTAPAATDRQVQLGGSVLITTSGGPAGLTSLLDFSPPTASLVSAKPAFNSRGLPCYVAGSRCDNIVSSATSSQMVSYILYLSDSRPVGANGWMAVTVSPAGRMRLWTYSGSGWAN